MKLYIYPKCSTCRKAIKYLSDKDTSVETVDISTTPPSKSELKKMLNAYEGNIRKLFNTSGMQYRELNMKEKLATLSDDEAISLLSETGMLVKRPFLLGKEVALVGFKQAEWDAVI